MTLNELLQEISKHLPHHGIVSTASGELAILTGVKYPMHVADTLEPMDYLSGGDGSISTSVPSEGEKEGER